MWLIVMATLSIDGLFEDWYKIFGVFFAGHKLSAVIILSIPQPKLFIESTAVYGGFVTARGTSGRFPSLGQIRHPCEVAELVRRLLAQL